MLLGGNISNAKFICGNDFFKELYVFLVDWLHANFLELKKKQFNNAIFHSLADRFPG